MLSAAALLPMCSQNQAVPEEWLRATITDHGISVIKVRVVIIPDPATFCEGPLAAFDLGTNS